MSKLVVAILALMAAVVFAKPSGMLLSMAKDKTICNTEVGYDENENRIPRVIKVVRCAADPYKMCPVSSGGTVRCCGAFPLADAAQFSCTEVQDSVLVSDTSMRNYTIKVAVGCACIKQDSTQAIE